MAYSNKDMKKIKLPKKSAMPANKSGAAMESGSDITDMMMDPRYLRQSSALIHDALQKGFDVLQLANGDIVTTGTKTVVYQYTWDHEKGKLVRAKAEKPKKSGRGAGGEPLDTADELEVDPEGEFA